MNIAAAIAAQQEALPPSTETPEPIELVVPPEEEKKDEAIVEEQPKKKGRPPANIIISGLKTQNSELLGVNERLMIELESERRRTAELNQKANESTFQNMALHESKLKTEAESAKKAYIDYGNAQDFAKQADAAAALARAESALNDVESWKTRNPKPEPQQQQPQQQQPRQQQQAPAYDPASAAWIAENPWFAPLDGGKPNPEFKKSIHLAAVAYATRLEEQLQAEGRGAEVSTPAYFEKLNQYVRKEFPEYFGEEEGEEEAQTPRTVVAPAVRTPAQSKQGSKTAPTLSAEERQFVDGMRTSGAMLYPSGHKQAGARMSPMDSYVAYWRQKQTGA